MASKIRALFNIIFIFLLLSSPQHAILVNSHAQSPSPFAFFKDLEGLQKGDKVEGISKLKGYLTKFGYLSYSYSKDVKAKDDYFDEVTESAIKDYQLYHNLKLTGTLDAKTLSKMMMPRCGLPDKINGGFHSNYAFFDGKPKWPPEKYKAMTYGFLPGTREDAIQPVTEALNKWASVSVFTFNFTENYDAADLKISFQSYDHGDGHPFDGPKGVIAHAFAPTYGRFHFDASETWAVGAVPNAIDMGTVALHEIGHLLGLQHSTVPEAIMYPSIPSNTIKGLNDDDIQAITNLYKL